MGCIIRAVGCDAVLAPPLVGGALDLEDAVFRRLLRALGFRRRGGTMPKPPPLRPGEQRVVLSPGWVSPEVRRYLSDEDIARINQGKTL